jgi:hypothetical protein
VSFNTPLGHPDRFQPGPPDLHPDAPALARQTARWTHSRFVRARTVYLSKSRQGPTAPRTAYSTCGTPAVNTLMKSFLLFSEPRGVNRERGPWSGVPPIPQLTVYPAPRPRQVQSFIFRRRDARTPQHPVQGLIGPPAGSLEPIRPPRPPVSPCIRCRQIRNPQSFRPPVEKGRPRSFRSEAASPPIARASVYPRSTGEASPPGAPNPRNARRADPPGATTSFCADAPRGRPVPDRPGPAWQAPASPA